MLAAAAAVGATDVERFSHGTTIATNALLERKGARTAFVATEGFEHLLHLRRQTRAHLYRLCAPQPEPLVPLERCSASRERIGPDGVLVPLDLDSLPELDAEAIAVCLLFSFRDPSHERAVAEELRRRLPGRARRRLARGRAGVPRVRARLDHRRRRVSRAGLARGTSARSARRARGGAARAARHALVRRRRDGRGGAAHPALVLVSGPAGGAVGAAASRGAAGSRTRSRSTWAAPRPTCASIVGGAVERGTRARASAGCRSGCRWSTSTRSAPAAARSSGVTRAVRCASGRRARARARARRVTGAAATRPTVTDANLLLGRLPERLAGGLELDREAAERAMDGIDPADVVEVVNAEMLRALRVVSVERGHDPRDFALVAFGGAGPLHACALAEELGIETVLVPGAAGVLSALGLVASEERRDARALVRRARSTEAGELPAERRGRPPLPRAVVRADRRPRRRPRGALPPGARGALRLRRSRPGRSSSSPCVTAEVPARGRPSTLPRRPGRRARPARPCSSWTARAAGFPRVGGVRRWRDGTLR